MHFYSEIDFYALKAQFLRSFWCNTSYVCLEGLVFGLFKKIYIFRKILKFISIFKKSDSIPLVPTN